MIYYSEIALVSSPVAAISVITLFYPFVWSLVRSLESSYVRSVSLSHVHCFNFVSLSVFLDTFI